MSTCEPSSLTSDVPLHHHQARQYFHKVLFKSPKGVFHLSLISAILDPNAYFSFSKVILQVVKFVSFLVPNECPHIPPNYQIMIIVGDTLQSILHSNVHSVSRFLLSTRVGSNIYQSLTILHLASSAFQVCVLQLIRKASSFFLFRGKPWPKRSHFTSTPERSSASTPVMQIGLLSLSFTPVSE
jgi:hypothetical protein